MIGEGALGSARRIALRLNIIIMICLDFWSRFSFSFLPSVLGTFCRLLMMIYILQHLLSVAPHLVPLRRAYRFITQSFASLSICYCMPMLSHAEI